VDPVGISYPAGRGRADEDEQKEDVQTRRRHPDNLGLTAEPVQIQVTRET
jgi:hypothetical protein